MTTIIVEVSTDRSVVLVLINGAESNATIGYTVSIGQTPTLTINDVPQYDARLYVNGVLQAIT